MKVYKFFKIPDKNEKHDIDIERKYVLYAITNNKEYAERFKDDRNMKKFICKTHKNITKEEYADMCNEDRSAVLEYRTLITIFDNHTRNNIVEKKVLMTYWEAQLLDEPNSALDDDGLWRSMPYPLIFKSKYRDCLNILQYITFYKLMTAEYLPYTLAEELSNYGDDYSGPSISYDEVALFINIIRETL